MSCDSVRSVVKVSIVYMLLKKWNILIVNWWLTDLELMNVNGWVLNNVFLNSKIKLQFKFHIKSKFPVWLKYFCPYEDETDTISFNNSFKWFNLSVTFIIPIIFISFGNIFYVTEIPKI